MELTLPLIILTIAGIIWFSSTIKKATNLIEKTMDVAITVANETNDIVEDSIKTYATEVSISNAEKRADQATRISGMSAIYTNDNIADLLKATSK